MNEFEQQLDNLECEVVETGTPLGFALAKAYSLGAVRFRNELQKEQKKHELILVELKKAANLSADCSLKDLITKIEQLQGRHHIDWLAADDRTEVVSENDFLPEAIQ